MIYKNTNYLLYGGNGSGKSSIILLLVGALRAENDSIGRSRCQEHQIFFRNTTNQSIELMSKENIMCTVQSDKPKFYVDNAKTHLERIETYLPKEPDCKLTQELIEWAKSNARSGGGLDIDLNEPAANASGGTQAKHDMLKVLARLSNKEHAPNLIIMDEITSPADPTIVHNFRCKLKDLIKERQDENKDYQPSIIEISHHDHKIESKGSEYPHQTEWNCSEPVVSINTNRQH